MVHILCEFLNEYPFILCDNYLYCFNLLENLIVYISKKIDNSFVIYSIFIIFIYNHVI